MSCEDLVSIGEMPPWQVRQGCACSYLIRGVAHTNNYRTPRAVPPDLMAFWALLGDPNNSTPRVQQEPAALQDFSPTYVRFGS